MLEDGYRRVSQKSDRRTGTESTRRHSESVDMNCGRSFSSKVTHVTDDVPRDLYS